MLALQFVDFRTQIEFSTQRRTTVRALRSMRNADLLGFGADDISSVENTFRNLCQIIVDDGIEFDPQSIKGMEIRKEAGYGGVRIDMIVKLDDARIAPQVNIGFDNADRAI